MDTFLNPKRTVAELKELRSFTGDENGAQRVAFTRTWVEARAWLRKKLEALPVEIHNDAAGNAWTTLRGETERALALCQKLLSFAGPLQLYAEEIDATTGQHLGNFPQAFTHLALIEAVSLLIETDPAGNVGPSYNPPPAI